MNVLQLGFGEAAGKRPAMRYSQDTARHRRVHPRCGI
jgi:hypothetical protein